MKTQHYDALHVMIQTHHDDGDGDRDDGRRDVRGAGFD